MKIALVVLILYFSINLIPAFGFFNFGAKKDLQHSTVSSNTNRTVSPPARSALKQQDQASNRTNSHPRPAITSKKNHTNHSPLQRVVNQHHSKNTTVAHLQADSVNKKPQQQQNRSSHNHGINNTNNRIIHHRSRPVNKNNKTNVTPMGRRIVAQDSVSKSNATNSQPNNQPFQRHSALAGAKVKNATANNNNRNQPRLRPSYQHKNVSRTHTNNNSTLKRRNRRSNSNVLSDPFNSMAFVRNEPINAEDFD